VWQTLCTPTCLQPLVGVRAVGRQRAGSHGLLRRVHEGGRVCRRRSRLSPWTSRLQRSCGACKATHWRQLPTENAEEGSWVTGK